VARDPFESMPATIELPRAWDLLQLLSPEDEIPVGLVVAVIDAAVGDAPGTKRGPPYWQQEPARSWLLAESSTVRKARFVFEAVITQIGIGTSGINQSRVTFSLPRISTEARRALDAPVDWLFSDSKRVGNALKKLFVNRLAICLAKAAKANDGRPSTIEQLAARLASYPARLWRDGLSFQKLYLVCKAMKCSPSELIPSLEELEAKLLRLTASGIEDAGALALLRYRACTPVRNHDGYLHAGSVASVLACDGATFNSLSVCGSAIIRSAECACQALPLPAS
jgi:hypothetical protein